jgi:hypothetical protein
MMADDISSIRFSLFTAWAMIELLYSCTTWALIRTLITWYWWFSLINYMNAIDISVDWFLFSRAKMHARANFINTFEFSCFPQNFSKYFTASTASRSHPPVSRSPRIPSKPRNSGRTSLLDYQVTIMPHGAALLAETMTFRAQRMFYASHHFSAYRLWY